VALNIIGNAINNTDIGYVSIHAIYDFKSQQITFTVKDTGIGIKKDDQDMLFSMFDGI
jgi:signal transduction histidine kinase